MMNYRLLTLSISAAAVLSTVACTPREQEQVSSSARTTANEARRTTEQAANQAERVIDDSVITTKIKTLLAEDDFLKSFQISVETRKGIVQMSGFVDNQKHKDKAGQIARGVGGVKSVNNALIVK